VRFGVRERLVDVRVRGDGRRPTEEGPKMWAQLISLQVKPGAGIDAVIEAIKGAELPGSPLISELFLRDQKDPSRFYVVPLFRSEEEARARESDPRRAEATATIQSLLGDLLAGPPQFHELDVVEHWIL
jgi:hypothetical protein